MIITGPTDLVDDHDGKKANQGLAWLLKNWSAVADGLLEPDFDIDVDSIVAACSPIVPQPSPQPELTQQLAPPTPSSPTMARNFEMPSTPRAAPTPPNGGFSTFPPPPIPFVEPVPQVPEEEQVSTPMSDVPRYLNSLDDDDDGEEDEEAKSEEEMARDQSHTKTPRPQSDSSYATSIETPPTGEFGDHRTSMKHIEPVQLSPEDERGEFSQSYSLTFSSAFLILWFSRRQALSFSLTLTATMLSNSMTIPQSTLSLLLPLLSLLQPTTTVSLLSHHHPSSLKTKSLSLSPNKRKPSPPRRFLNPQLSHLSNTTTKRMRTMSSQKISTSRPCQPLLQQPPQHRNRPSLT